MTETSTGTRGEPQFASLANAATFAADLSAVATFAAEVGIRQFATAAAIAASTGSGSGEFATNEAVPGSLYWFNSASGHWQLANRPTVANAAAIGSLFSGTLVPVQGDEVRQLDVNSTMRYSAAYNSSSNPLSPYLVAGWYSAAPAGYFKGSLTTSKSTGTTKWGISTGPTFDTIIDPDSGFSTASGVFTVQRGGLYVIALAGKQSGTANVALSCFRSTGGGAFASLLATPNFPATAFNGAAASVVDRLLPGDQLYVVANGTYTTTSDSPADNNFVSLAQIGF